MDSNRGISYQPPRNQARSTGGQGQGGGRHGLSLHAQHSQSMHTAEFIQLARP